MQATGKGVYTDTVTYDFTLSVLAPVVHIDASTLTDISALNNQSEVASSNHLTLEPYSLDTSRKVIGFTTVSDTGNDFTDYSNIVFEHAVTEPLVAIVFKFDSTDTHRNWLFTGDRASDYPFHPGIDDGADTSFFSGQYSALKNVLYNGVDMGNGKSITKNTEWSILIAETSALNRVLSETLKGVCVKSPVPDRA